MPWGTATPGPIKSSQALEAYRASLKLNPNQEDVKKIVQGLEKSK